MKKGFELSLNDLRAGIYDSLVTRELAERIRALPSNLAPTYTQPDPGESHQYFARHAMDALRELLRLVDGEGTERLRIQADVCNEALLAIVQDASNSSLVVEPVQLLTEIRNELSKSGLLPR